MTKEYANPMWQRYLRLLARTDDGRIIPNPAIQFTKNAKAGLYDKMSDAQYNIALKDVEEESILFKDAPKSSAYALFVRGFQKLSLTNAEICEIAKVLSTASARVDFRHNFPASDASDTSFDTDEDAF